jgi:GT2 family glycosyltransferase
VSAGVAAKSVNAATSRSPQTVHILVPCHNNKREVLDLLRCLNTQTFRGLSIIVVDDGSTDGTEEAVRCFSSEITILNGNGHLWWTGANVLGIEHILKHAGPSDFILLLNNDVAVDNDYVQVLVDASVMHARAIVGSALYDFRSKHFVESGIVLDERLRASVNRDSTTVDRREFDDHVNVLPGRGTLIPIEVFSEIGTLNSRQLPHYGADYEFSIRARRAGYRLIVSHRAKVYAKLDVTGLECPVGKVLSMKECGKFLFSRKSKINVVYYLRYVWLCSERQWRVRNTIDSAVNIVSLTIGQTLIGRFIYMVMFPIVRAIRKPYTLLSSRGHD